MAPNITRRRFLTDRNLGFLLAIGGALLFSAKGIFIKFSYQLGADALTVLSLRLLLAAPLYLLLWRREERLKTPGEGIAKNLWRIALAGFLGYYLSSFLDFKGLEILSAGTERIILYTYPGFVVLLGWFFLKKRPSWKMGLALVLSYAGVLLAYSGDSDFDPEHGPIGLLLVLGAALSYASFLLSSDSLQKRLGTNRFTAIALLTAGLFVNIHYLISGGSYQHDPGVWLWCAVLAVFGTFLPSLMLMHGIRLLGAARATVVGGIGPIMTMVLGAIFLGEGSSWLELTGLALAIIGGFLAKSAEQPISGSKSSKSSTP
jgi:drug/metabolite transporter (DMT)-like permease